MNRLFCLVILFVFATQSARAQELFIQAEPASTMPKGVIGIRAFTQAYEDPGNYLRDMTALRFMYGLTPKLTVMANVSASNHHSAQLPPDFPDHNTPQIGVRLPWRFNGLELYAKYRFLSKDGERQHFRISAYAAASWLDVAHDEAEPELLDDTKGVGAGLIATWLKNHFAASLTAGFILPADYKGDVPDELSSLPSIAARVKYGRALNYSLSFGYLLLPKKYTDYNQANINLYAELVGKSYEGGHVYFENLGSGSAYEIKGAAASVFSSNTYVELHPGVQAIFGSNLRLDLSVGFPLLSKSYARFYPLYTLGVQRYFFRTKKR